MARGAAPAGAAVDTATRRMATAEARILAAAAAESERWAAAAAAAFAREFASCPAAVAEAGGFSGGGGGGEGLPRGRLARGKGVARALQLDGCHSGRLGGGAAAGAVGAAADRGGGGGAVGTAAAACSRGASSSDASACEAAYAAGVVALEAGDAASALALLEAAAAACPSAKARALDKIEVRASEARAALALQNGRTSGVRAANGGSNGAHEAPGPPQGGTAQSSKDGEDARAADAAYRGGGAALRQGDVAAALGLFRAAAEVCPAGERAARDKIERAVAACQAKLLDQGHQ